MLPTNSPDPLENHVVVISYHDANLHYGVIDGRSVTRVLCFLDKTPSVWLSKKKASVETATYGSINKLKTRSCM